MNILYIVTGLGIGGAEIVTVDIANKMSDRGHCVSIINLSDINELRGRINPQIDVYSIGMEKSPLSFFRAIHRAASYVKKVKPEVVHANMIHANIFARVLRIFAHMDFLISTAHSQNEGGKLRMLAYRLTDCLSDLNTNVSKDAVSHYVRNKWFSGKKSIYVYNGIDKSRFRHKSEARIAMRQKFALGDHDFCFLFVGRMTEAKDIPNLLEAFSILSAKEDNVKLVLVGGGELYDEMRSLAVSKHISENTFFEGSCSDVVDYYSMADCFVMSSAWEGFGMVLVEAMSCGLPVLATDAGGCAEIVADGKFIVPVKDAGALAEKLEEMIHKSPEEISAIKERNYLLSESFSLDRIVDEWENIYREKIVPQKKL